VLGSVVPRLWTPPLRDLSRPEASWGHLFIAFCIAIGWPLDLWQQWLAIHLGELFPDGSPRYRKAIILVARQNGKTVFCRLLILYWMFVERVSEIVGTSTDRSAAKRSWKKVIEMAEGNELLAALLPKYHVRKLTAEEDFWNDYGSHYRFAASNSSAGRGDTLPRALLDELRQHKNRDVWDAVVPATAAVADGLVVAISNEGDSSSVVLHEEADAAENFILTGEGDHRTFLASWSAPSGSDPTDLEALAMANPSLGRIRPDGTGIRGDDIRGDAMTAASIGGETLARFKIERLCMRVDLLESAIRIEDWRGCGVKREDAIDMAEHRRSVALCFDVSESRDHATLAAAVTMDGITWIEIVASWDGYEARKQLRADLPGWLRRIKPRKCVWFPGGPAAAVADEWAGRRLANVIMEPIRAEDVVRSCMALEEQAAARHLRHAHDPLADLHIRQTQQLPQGDGWRFARRGQAPIDASYAMAGAVHAARVLPKLGPAV
jgi:phage terminase large subunit-like protein